MSHGAVPLSLLTSSESRKRVAPLVALADSRTGYPSVAGGSQSCFAIWMKFLTAVQLCSVLLTAWGRSLLDGKTTTSALAWYIAAEEVEWDYLPGGENKCKRPESHPETNQGRDVSEKDPNDHALWTTAGLGTVLKKAAYVQYTDQSFQVSTGGYHLPGASLRSKVPSQHAAGHLQRPCQRHTQDPAHFMRLLAGGGTQARRVPTHRSAG